MEVGIPVVIGVAVGFAVFMLVNFIRNRRQDK